MVATTEAMKPFADDGEAMQVGNLTVENGIHRVSVSGSLDLVRDRESLEHAKALQAFFAAAVETLQAVPGLPAKSPAPTAAGTTTAKNPFA